MVSAVPIAPAVVNTGGTSWFLANALIAPALARHTIALAELIEKVANAYLLT